MYYTPFLPPLDQKYKKVKLWGSVYVCFSQTKVSGGKNKRDCFAKILNQKLAIC